MKIKTFLITLSFAIGFSGCAHSLMRGTVTSILNDHYSVVKFDPGVLLEEGTLVERR